MKCPACTFQNPSEMRFCGRCGSPLGKADPQTSVAESPDVPVAAAAELRQLTVMFCDLVGSTALSEKLEPEHLREVVLAYQKTSSEVIERFGGHVAQLLGDGILVYFGYPQAHEDDPRRAVHTALGIVEAMATLNECLEPSLDSPLEVRVGIHTGSVVTGDMGSDGRQQQLAIGQTPNVAARLQGLAQPNGVVLSASTHALVEGLFAFRHLGARQIKGVSAPVDVFEVLGESGVPERFQVVIRHGLPPLVGRREELGLLRGRFRKVREGRPQVALLNGEAGLGKSRLVHELKLTLSDELHTWWTCYCSPYHRNSALQPLIGLLQQLCEFRRGDSTRQKLSKLERGLESLGFRLEEEVPLLANLLSLTLPARYQPGDFSPQRQKEKTLDLLHRLVLRQAEEDPLVFLIENVHWVDPSTLLFLDLLRQPGSATKLFLLLTCRPAFRSAWTPEDDDVEIVVDRLSAERVEAMILHWTGGKELPRAVLRHVVEMTDGVPLFVEELTKTILESELLVEGEAAYELAGPLPALAIPSTLQDSLRARLDHLPPGVKKVAQVGSVVGRTFSHELLEMIAPENARDLAPALDHMVRAQLLVQEDARPAAPYRFKHMMIQEATYGSLLKRRRRRYHRRIAQALESRFPEVGEAQPEVLAHHYTEALESESAVDYWHLAGQRSFRQSAILEAAAHLDRGLALLNSLPTGAERDRRELALQAVLGAALSTVKGFAAPEVNQAYGRALEICQQSADAPELFWILWGLWRFHFARANFDKALELGNRLIRLAEPQDPARRIAACLSVGATLCNRGELAAASDYLEQGVRLDSRERHQHYAAETGEDSGVAVLCWLAWCRWHMGFPERAEKRIAQARALAHRVSHTFSLIYSLAFSSYLAYFRRDPAGVLEYAGAVHSQSLEQGSWWAVPAGIFLDWAHAVKDRDRAAERSGKSGDREKVVVSIRDGLNGYLGSGTRVLTTEFLSMQAEALAGLGRVEDAMGSLDQAVTVIRETGEELFEAEVHRLRGEVEQMAGEETGERQAESSFRHALEVARRQSSRSLELRAALSLSRLWARQGRKRQARELLAPIFGWFTEGFDESDLREARALLDELARDSGHATHQ